MKSIKYLSLIVIMLFVSISVNAAEITSTSYDGKIKIEGSGSGQVQIVLFDLENNPLYMTTTEAENGVFNITLPKIDGLEEGNYNLKVADYDGSNVDDSIVKIENIEEENNPKTGDNIVFYIITGSVSLIGLGVLSSINKKRYN